ncbi:MULTISPECIES: GGDEF domain-containing protein [Cyanophyceae]|uniref:GGDEF domain-containing protein n=1 Tax=Leptolyngbya subtilissima DQ-A4 TaxID=2933933 RepID=A0ABV0KCV4_9CYAN|nr:GGDEF domain-containing protein [Nodosilinea sp. FACHB-141]
MRLLSLTDELTGLHNRRGFFLLAEQQLKLATRLKTAFNVLFIDLDGLKQINDLQGHETGDVALWAAANVLKRTFRESDLVARLGGDEFVVLAPGNSEERDQLQHRLQDGIDQFNQQREAPFQLSMSIGSYIYETGETRSLEDILALADQQMYEQKRLKRQSTG